MEFRIQSLDYTNPDHQKKLIELMDCYSQDPMGGGNPLSDYTRKNLLPTLARLPTALSILATQDNKAAGLINCFESLSTFSCRPLINIHDVIVKSEYRGEGLSQQMLEKVEEVARQRHACKLTLEVLEGNQAARNAYQKFGFSGYQLDPGNGNALFWEKKLH